MTLLRRSPERTIALNMLAEVSGSGIYSLLYFIFVSRFLSSGFGMSYAVLAYSIGLAFFAAVYIPFHTYRIHIIPFISVMTALRKRQWRVLWHKIPAQALGAAIGVQIFNWLRQITATADIAQLATIDLDDPLLSALLNGTAAAVLCYAFYIIRILFKQRRSSGTLFIGLLIATIFLLTGRVAGISALNPFGWLFVHLSSGSGMYGIGLTAQLLTHLVAPVGMSVAAFYFVRGMYARPGTRQAAAAFSNFDA